MQEELMMLLRGHVSFSLQIEESIPLLKTRCFFHHLQGSSSYCLKNHHLMFASLAYAYPLYNGHSLLELQYNLYQLDRSSCRIDPKSPKSFLLTTLDNSTTSDAVTAIL